MILVWKLPMSVDISAVRQLKGNNGSTLNPIEDADGNWVVSEEEYCASEFQQLKRDYSDIWANMERIVYNPIIRESIV